MNIYNILEEAASRQASDLHISVNSSPICRIFGKLVKLDYPIITPENSFKFCKTILTENQLNKLHTQGEIDLSFNIKGNNRIRANFFKQKGVYSLAFRFIIGKIAEFSELGLPASISNLCNKTMGLILVTGPTGTGKTTSLTSMVDWININRGCHIVTIEEPIEYVHEHKLSIVNQREIGSDSASYSSALKSVLRQDPDVILVGEMRDLESIAITLTAAETGHLVMSTLHTTGAAKTIDRIIDVFSPHQQHQIRTQLSMVLEGVISQQLIPSLDGKSVVLAYEIMIATPAIKHLIRENKIHQISNVIETASNEGMITMDKCLVNLYKRKKISRDNAIMYSMNTQEIKRMLASTL